MSSSFVRFRTCTLWYSWGVAPSDQIRSAAARGHDVARLARQARSSLRRQTDPGGERRERTLAKQIALINTAMEPIRSYVGRLPHLDLIDPDLEADLRAASRSLQYERRQLKKMQRREE